MSNPAQEEADRLFNNKTFNNSHPEDRDISDHETDSELDEPGTKFRAGRLRRDSDSEEDNNVGNMTTSSSKNTYTLPSATRFANTGPKGVIADAQNYHRSKRRAFRQTLESISNNLSLGPRPTKRTVTEKPSKRGSGSDLEISEEDDNDEFMQQWRQQRLAELKQQAESQQPQQRRQSPSVRTYGRLDLVDADGYLDAIEKCPSDAVVVVLLYDNTNPDCAEVEEELERLAYKWTHVHFVKLPHDVAEMETVDIPAVLAYRGGDVFATISGAVKDGLEDVLREQGVLMRRS